MRFGHLFEYHKIPDWYTEYVNYKDLKDKVVEFKRLRRSGATKRLKGYYMINRQGQLYCIDFIQDYTGNNSRRRQARVVTPRI